MVEQTQAAESTLWQKKQQLKAKFTESNTSLGSVNLFVGDGLGVFCLEEEVEEKEAERGGIGTGLFEIPVMWL